MNTVIYVTFISERFPLLIDYEKDEQGFVLVSSVRLIRQVVNGGTLYNRADGFCKAGPVYEAVWLHGKGGINHLLSSAQLVRISDLVTEKLAEPHYSVPEESVVYPKVV